MAARKCLIQSFPINAVSRAGQRALSFAHTERNLKHRQMVGKQNDACPHPSTRLKLGLQTV